ncbi:hypothetical protein PYW08_007532 [Mythimna loreyi]|uniref:Uncharacterized protein n=1 Tax=Mythimna loreyi TaxID=667449 RepID=A0ACC2QCJ8_9NEOP|nr:hypothetical protein PYW08_007532 [Mythimna loreyi]
MHKSVSHWQLRQNVKVEDVSRQYKLWAFIAPPDFTKDFIELVMEHEIKVFKDPRLADLGHRLITTPEMGQLNMRQVVGEDTIIDNDEQDYAVLRYKLGVSEGAADIFPGTCCPLELNCDLLHGICFENIKYIGRELTIASIEHSGVKKRIMPVHFLNFNSKNEDFEKDDTIWANRECGKMSVGMLKNHVSSFGLGLLKVNEALEAKTLHIGSYPIVITQPEWWPEHILSDK